MLFINGAFYLSVPTSHIQTEFYGYSQNGTAEVNVEIDNLCQNLKWCNVKVNIKMQIFRTLHISLVYLHTNDG